MAIQEAQIVEMGWGADMEIPEDAATNKDNTRGSTPMIHTMGPKIMVATLPLIMMFSAKIMSSLDLISWEPRDYYISKLAGPSFNELDSYSLTFRYGSFKHCLLSKKLSFAEISITSVFYLFHRSFF